MRIMHPKARVDAALVVAYLTELAEVSRRHGLILRATHIGFDVDVYDKELVEDLSAAKSAFDFVAKELP